MRPLLIYLFAFLLLGMSSGFGESAPGDVAMERKTTGEETYAPATFPHWPHAIRYRCYVCHPAVFKMTTMELQRGSLKEDRKPFDKHTNALTPPAPEEGNAPETGEDAGEKNDAENAENTKSGKKTAAADASDVAQRAMHGPTGCGLCHRGGGPAFNVQFEACARCHKTNQ